MARTRQKARKSTGGHAEQRVLEHPTRVLRVSTPRSQGSPHPLGLTADLDIEMAEEASDPGSPTSRNDDSDEVSNLSRFFLFWPYDLNSGATYVVMGAMASLFATHVVLPPVKGVSHNLPPHQMR